MKQKKIIVIGAGVIGLTSAYYLAKLGHEVTILDEGDGLGNCSVGNAGFLCPSHVISLAAPGIITQGIKWMFNNKSPFYVKPKLDWDLINWGLQFKKAATHARVKKSAPILNEITLMSQKLTEELIEREQIEVGYKKSGLLMLCKTPDGLKHEIEAAEMAKSLGQKYEVLSKSEALSLNEGMEANIHGAVYFPDDSMMSPHIYVAHLRQTVQDLGAKIINGAAIKKIDVHQQSIVSVHTEMNQYEADEYIMAAGSWSTSLVKPLGISIPMQGGKGYSFMVKNPPIVPKTPAIFVEGKVSMSPMLDGLRFSGTMEIDGLSKKINQNRIEGIIETVQRFLPQFGPEQFEDITTPWAGHRPCSPDGLPYIGRSHHCKNLIVASGHAMLGLTLAAYTGAMVRDIVMNLHQNSTLNHLSVDRFE